MVVTPAEPGHAAAIAVLFEEMGEFYGTAEAGPPEQPVRTLKLFYRAEVGPGGSG